MAKSGTIDFMEPFHKLVDDIQRQHASGKGVDVTVSGSLLLDTEAAEETAFSVASLIVERIKHDLEETPLQVQPQTRERRRRARDETVGRSRTGGAVRAARYPGGFTPNPAGPYGEDSGLLRAQLLVNTVKGKKDVFAGIPKNRAKAAFVLRRASRLLSDDRALAGAVEETTRLRLKKIVGKAVRRAFRGSGIRTKLL